MLPIALPALAGVLLGLTFLSALAGYSLRDFSFSRLEDVCERRGRPGRFGQILKRYERTLLAVDVLTALCVVASAAVAVAWLDLWAIPRGVSGWFSWAVEVIASALALIGLTVVVPWAVSRVAAEHVLYCTWPALTALRAALRPITGVALWLDRAAHRAAGRPDPVEGTASTITEEIRSVVDEGQREGVIENTARSMINRVMDLAEADVAAIMTPRTDMVCVQVDSTLDEARRRLLEAGHSRVPVIGDSTDDVVGILYAKDLLKHIHSGEGRPVALREIARQPLYVPETTGIDTLLERMKREHIHIAIVIDEYSGVSGLVTMEDILEEIVGEIVDEYDLETRGEEITVLEPGVIDVDARVRVDELNDRFDLDLPDDADFDTIGGFVYTHLGRIPSTHEELTWRNLRIKVLGAGERKIHRLRIEVDESLAAAASEER